MLPILLTTLIFTYFIYATHVLDLHKPALEALCKPVGDWFGEAGNPVRASVWVGASVVSLIAWLSPESSFLGEMRGEITGMSITVIVIDELVGYRNRLERKQEIFEQVQSPVRDIAVEALSLARKNGWLNELIQKKKLVEGQFQGAKLSRAKLEGADFYLANLEGADLSYAKLQGASLFGANLKDIKLMNAKLGGADLSYANLKGAVLFMANLEGADLSYADLEGADLHVANFKGADLLDVKLDNAIYSPYTTFPKGFNPDEAGAIFTENGEIYP